MCTQLLRVSANTIDTAFQSEIKKAMPNEFAEMEAKLQEYKLKMEDSEMVEIEFVVGHYYK